MPEAVLYTDLLQNSQSHPVATYSELHILVNNTIIHLDFDRPIFIAFTSLSVLSDNTSLCCIATVDNPDDNHDHLECAENA